MVKEVNERERERGGPYILKRSPAARQTGESDLRGLKWHTQLLRDTQVGNAIPAVVYIYTTAR